MKKSKSGKQRKIDEEGKPNSPSFLSTLLYRKIGFVKNKTPSSAKLSELITSSKDGTQLSNRPLKKKKRRVRKKKMKQYNAMRKIKLDDIMDMSDIASPENLYPPDLYETAEEDSKIIRDSHKQARRLSLEMESEHLSKRTLSKGNSSNESGSITDIESLEDISKAMETSTVRDTNESENNSNDEAVVENIAKTHSSKSTSTVDKEVSKKTLNL